MSVIYSTSKGVTIYVETGFDLSSATNVELHFSGPPGTIVNSASVSVITSNITASACDNAVFSALKTLKYVTNSGDFSTTAGAPQVQTWKGWAEVDFNSGTRLVSSTFKFTVKKPGY